MSCLFSAIITQLSIALACHFLLNFQATGNLQATNSHGCYWWHLQNGAALEFSPWFLLNPMVLIFKGPLAPPKTCSRAISWASASVKTLVGPKGRKSPVLTLGEVGMSKVVFLPAHAREDGGLMDPW